MDQIASDVVSQTFFNLLEGVSIQLQMVFLRNCSVLELNQLALTSRWLRKAVIETMGERDLEIDILEPYSIVPSLAVYVIDVRNESRNVRIDFCYCGIRGCCPWKKIGKLLYFCRHAYLKRIDYVPMLHHIFPPMPAHSAYFQLHNGTSTDSTETAYSQVFVDRSKAFARHSLEFLNFVSPLKLTIYTGEVFDCLSKYRGATSPESNSITFDNCFNTRLFYIGDMILKLPQPRISVITSWHNMLFHVGCTLWSPRAVVAFVEQWVQKRRDIEHVQSILHFTNATPNYNSFGAAIFKDLVNVTQRSQTAVVRKLDEKLKDRMQLLENGQKIYMDIISFSPDAFVFNLLTSDDRSLTIILTAAWNGNELVPLEDRPIANTGFIDIFPT